MTTALFDTELDTQLEAIWQQGQMIRDDHEKLRRTPPLVRLWANNPAPGGGLILRGIAADSISGGFGFKKNKAGSGTLRLRADHYLAHWVISIPNDPAAKKNVVITVDHMGGKIRWSGLLKYWHFRKDTNGIRYVEITFIDDLQFLDFLLGAPNPLLPLSIFQFPRVFTVLGPAVWACSLLIWMNLLRYQANLWNLPDDPFDISSWIDPYDPSTWQVLITGPTFTEDSSLWTLVSSRMDKVSASIADALDDAQLVLTYRRILTVDGEVCDVPGVSDPRNGVLVLEIIDKSGYFDAAGTSFGGSALDGFARSVISFLSGFVDDVQTLTVTSSQPSEYFLADWFGVVPTHPWIVLRDSRYTGIDTADLSWAPATAGQIVVGGGNEYADSAVELAIQAVGNILGYFLLGGFSSAGDLAATVIMPLLRGTVLAWNNWKSGPRVDNLGWVHLMEYFQQGANNAWTLSAIAALRAGMRATAAETSFQMDIRNGAPYLVGLHMQIGDRIAGTIEGMTGSITTDPLFVEQIEELNLAWDYASDTPHSWEIKVGTGKASMTTAERSTRLLSKTMATLQNIGVSI